MKKEIKLILLSCLCSRNDNENEELKCLFAEDIDWTWVVGQLIRHRLDGYFYCNISDEQHARINKHVDKAFRILSNNYVEINKTNLQYMNMIMDELKKRNVHVAGLKGVILNTSIYSLNLRRSNDVDVLVAERDLKIFDEVMRKFGFIQSLNRGESEATRKEKLIQIMNYHDLVPYYKKLDDGKSKIEVDVNFQFDSKNNEITEEVLNYGLQSYSKNGFNMRGLRWETHLAHLAVHFYREATNSLWSDKGSDVDMYKIIDIENTFRQFNKEDVYKWIDTIHKFKLEQQCYYTLFYLNIFYPNNLYEDIMEKIKPDSTSYVFQIKRDGTDKYEDRTDSFLNSAFGLY